jgi:hypothetical protein
VVAPAAAVQKRGSSQAIRSACWRPRGALGACASERRRPRSADATATTPALPVTLAGPAYFVSNGGEAFPDLIVVLQGDGVTVDLTGTTFISKQGITSSTFATVPDVPVG